MIQRNTEPTHTSVPRTERGRQREVFVILSAHLDPTQGEATEDSLYVRASLEIYIPIPTYTGLY